MTTEATFFDTGRQAIRTRYHGPTDTLGARISASYAGGLVGQWKTQGVEAVSDDPTPRDRSRP